MEDVIEIEIENRHTLLAVVLDHVASTQELSRSQVHSLTRLGLRHERIETAIAHSVGVRVGAFNASSQVRDVVGAYAEYFGWLL